MQNETPPSAPAHSNAQYIWAVVMLTITGVALTLGVLYLRPLTDPLTVLGQVAGVLAPTTAAVLALLKAQETHLSVNSRLDAFIIAHAKNARAEGVAIGTAAEQARVAALPVVTPVPGGLEAQLADAKIALEYQRTLSATLAGSAIALSPPPMQAEIKTQPGEAKS